MEIVPIPGLDNVRKVAAIIPVTDEIMQDTNTTRFLYEDLEAAVAENIREQALVESLGPRLGPGRHEYRQASIQQRRIQNLRRELDYQGRPAGPIYLAPRRRGTVA